MSIFPPYYYYNCHPELDSGLIYIDSEIGDAEINSA
jgi:hypothetical protein